IGVELSRRRQSSSHRTDGRNDNIYLLIAESPQRCRSSLLNVGMRTESSIRMPLPCGERAYPAYAISVELGLEIVDVRCGRFDCPIVRGNDYERAMKRLSQTGNE